MPEGVPTARAHAAAWADDDGNAYIFGGSTILSPSDAASLDAHSLDAQEWAPLPYSIGDGAVMRSLTDIWVFRNGKEGILWQRIRPLNEPTDEHSWPHLCWPMVISGPGLDTAWSGHSLGRFWLIDGAAGSDVADPFSKLVSYTGNLALVAKTNQIYGPTKNSSIADAMAHVGVASPIDLQVWSFTLSTRTWEQNKRPLGRAPWPPQLHLPSTAATSDGHGWIIGGLQGASATCAPRQQPCDRVAQGGLWRFTQGGCEFKTDRKGEMYEL